MADEFVRNQATLTWPDEEGMEYRGTAREKLSEAQWRDALYAFKTTGQPPPGVEFSQWGGTAGSVRDALGRAYRATVAPVTDAATMLLSAAGDPRAGQRGIPVDPAMRVPNPAARGVAEAVVPQTPGQAAADLVLAALPGGLAAKGAAKIPGMIGRTAAATTAGAGAEWATGGNPLAGGVSGFATAVTGEVVNKGIDVANKALLFRLAKNDPQELTTALAKFAPEGWEQKTRELVGLRGQGPATPEDLFAGLTAGVIKSEASKLYAQGVDRIVDLTNRPSPKASFLAGHSGFKGRYVQGQETQALPEFVDVPELAKYARDFMGRQTPGTTMTVRDALDTFQRIGTHGFVSGEARSPDFKTIRAAAIKQLTPELRRVNPEAADTFEAMNRSFRASRELHRLFTGGDDAFTPADIRRLINPDTGVLDMRRLRDVADARLDKIATAFGDVNKEDMHKVLEALYRGVAPGSRDLPGRGIGLSVGPGGGVRLGGMPRLPSFIGNPPLGAPTRPGMIGLGLSPLTGQAGKLVPDQGRQ